MKIAWLEVNNSNSLFCKIILGLTYFLILKRRALALFSLMERSLT